MSTKELPEFTKYEEHYSTVIKAGGGKELFFLHWVKRWSSYDGGPRKPKNAMWVLMKGEEPQYEILLSDRFESGYVRSQETAMRKEAEHRYLMGTLIKGKLLGAAITTETESSTVIGLTSRQPSPCCTEGLTKLYPKACWLWNAQTAFPVLIDGKYVRYVGEWLLYDGDRVHTDCPVQDGEDFAVAELQFLAGVLT